MSRFSEFLETQKKQQLLEQLLKHVEAAPADPRVRLRLGDVLQGLKRIDEAVVQYREAAILLSRRGFDKQARAVRALILRLVPGEPGVLRDLAFETDLELARTQEPLEREAKMLGEDDELGGEDAFDLPEDDDPDAMIIVSRSGGRGLSAHAPERKAKEEPLAPALPWSVAMPPAPAPAATALEDGITVDVENDAADRGLPARPRDRRNDPRAHADGVVRLHANGVSATGFLEDVSQTGLFVSGPRLYPIGTYVDLALQLPQAAWIGLARARVMRSVEATRRRPAGLGLALIWTDTPTDRWIEDFVSTVFGASAVRPRARYEADGGKREEDIRRAHPRGEIDLPAALRSNDFEVTGWVRDLSLGGAFVEAPRVFGPGRRVELLLWMPGSYAPIVIDSVVAHDNRPPANGHGAGTGIRFIRVSEALEGELRKLLP